MKNAMLFLATLAAVLVASLPAKACPYNVQAAAVVATPTVIVQTPVIAAVTVPVVGSQVVIPTPVVVATPFVQTEVIRTRGRGFGGFGRLAGFGAGLAANLALPGSGGLVSDLATTAGELFLERAILGRGAGFGGFGGGFGRARNVNSNSNNTTSTTNVTNNITRAPRPAPAAAPAAAKVARPAAARPAVRGRGK